MKIQKLNKNRTHLIHSLESYCSCSCSCPCQCACNPFHPHSGPGATGYTTLDNDASNRAPARSWQSARVAGT